MIGTGNVRIHILTGALIQNQSGASSDGISDNTGGATASTLFIQNDGTVRGNSLGGGNFGADLALNSNLGATTIVNNGLWQGVQAGLTLRSTGPISITNNAGGTFSGSITGIDVDSAQGAVINNWGDILSTAPSGPGNRAIQDNSASGTGTVNLWGGNVTGNVNLRGGADALALAGGNLTGNATLGTGDDTFGWSGGTFVGSLLGGDGSDTAAISAATYDGSQVLDGGDDLSTADGMTDRLTLTGVNVTTPGTRIVNWEDVTLDGGSLLFSDGAFASGSDTGTGLHVTGGGILNGGTGLTLTGNLDLTATGSLLAHGGGAGVYAVSGDFFNAGLVDALDGQAGDRITAGGNYTGGGMCMIDTALGGDGSLTDALVVTGDTAGTTTLVVSNAGGAGAQTVNGIRVVTVLGNSAGSFVLQGGSITAGSHIYTLSQKLDGNWYLLSALLGPTAGTPDIYEAMAGTLLSRLPTLEQRVGQRRWLALGDAGQDGIEPAEGAWLRAWGNRSDLSPAGSVATRAAETQEHGFQFGYDHPVEPGDSGQWVLGVTGQAGGSSVDVTTASDSGRIASHSAGLGLTATWYGENGLYADLQGQVNRLRVNTDTVADGVLLKGRRFTSAALSAELGYRHAVNAATTLVPQAQLTWSHLSGGRFSDAQGNSVDLGNPDRLVGRLGLAWEYEAPTQGGDRTKYYAIGNILHDFSGTHAVTVNGGALMLDTSATWAEVGFGGSSAWDDGKRIYFEANYRRAISDASSEGFGLTGGFSILF